MTQFPESHRDLLDAEVASLATITRDGCPHGTEVDLANPYRYLEMRGSARMEPDDDYAFARKVGAKYDVDLSAHDQHGESRVVVTIEPTNVYAVDMRGG